MGSLEQEAQLRATVDQTIKPLMKKYDVPGMALALTDHGKHYVFNYGLASRETRQPVDRDTLFEIGSVSKTLVATLAGYAQAQGRLALSDKVSQHMPALRGSSFDHVNLIHLGTHTAGDFPMQVPDDIKNYDQLMDYYRGWRQPAGVRRTYSNLGIGLLGMISAQSMGLPFADAMEHRLLPALGMHQTYINVPADQMQHYAQGYNDANAPVRVHPGVLASEAYGVKTTAADLIRFVDANLGQAQLDDSLRLAVDATHIGYFQAGKMTQDLIWEQFPAAAGLPGLLVSASEQMVWQSNPVTPLTPPLAPQSDVLLHKTGSTGGFGAYVLFSPGRKTGIVMLANKGYPGAARITAAYRILARLE
ncbi:class C beta-lactamase [Duganella rhizosphaerae]|uniref:class C beta-lactamase n=1 Tax=Duganella rhizosphaerae TaxID=2885763 RepID=UPI00403F57AD